MSNWIDELSNSEDKETTRIRRVAANNTHIFELLVKEIKAVASLYNERHPQGIGFPDALTIQYEPVDSATFGLRLQKNNDPKGRLNLEFPINSGGIIFQQSSSAWSRDGRILLDVKDDKPMFYLEGESYSAEKLVEALLKPMLTAVDPWAKFRTDAANRLNQAERAVGVLQEVDKHTAASELREANADLGKAPPDRTGAVQHALAALECIAREYCDDHATFGKLLERYPDLFPKPLDIGMEKIWGFASEMGRHLQEGREPTSEEAELLVGLAVAGCTYLARKIRLAPVARATANPN